MFHKVNLMNIFHMVFSLLCIRNNVNSGPVKEKPSEVTKSSLAKKDVMESKPSKPSLQKNVTEQTNSKKVRNTYISLYFHKQSLGKYRNHLVHQSICLSTFHASVSSPNLFNYFNETFQEQIIQLTVFLLHQG